MTAALAWLNDLMQWLGRWIPRPVLIRATHTGVRFGRRGRVATLGPGLHWYWPIVQELELVMGTRRTMTTSPQLQHGEVVGLIITYQVVHAATTLLTLADLHANLDQRAQALLSLVYRKDLTDAQLVAGVRDPMHEEFNAYGVCVIDVGIAQRGWVIPIKQVADWSYHEEKKL